METESIFTASQNRFFNIVLNTNRNIFLTGSAGTGKTFALKKIRDRLRLANKKYLVVAPTGAAAANADGKTIHSTVKPLPLARIQGRRFSKLPSRMADTHCGILTDEDTCPTVKFNDDPVPWSEIDVLFIEEISMVDAGLFAVIDKCLQRARGNTRSFGGVRIIVVGDFMQLRPVGKRDGETDSASTGLFAFQKWRVEVPPNKKGHEGVNVTAWQNANFVYCPLLENVRQKDDHTHRDVCETIRSGLPMSSWPNNVKDALNRCAEYKTYDQLVAFKPKFKNAPRVYWANKKLTDYNNMRNGHLTGWIADIETNISCVANPRATRAEMDLCVDEVKDHLRNSNISLDTIKLYQGTRLMITRNNDTIADHFNGKIGSIDRMEKKILADGTEKTCLYVGGVSVPLIEDTCEFDFEREDALPVVVVVKYSFYPVTLAFALTYHKMQGATMKTPLILMMNGGMGRNIGGANMAYTGFTRATHIDNIAILVDTNPDDRDFYNGNILQSVFQADKSAIAFYTQMASKDKPVDWGTVQACKQRECMCCGAVADVLFQPCMHAAACRPCTLRTRNNNVGSKLTCVACSETVMEAIEIASNPVLM